jgi:hypothetical protein
MSGMGEKQTFVASVAYGLTGRSERNPTAVSFSVMENSRSQRGPGPKPRNALDGLQRELEEIDRLITEALNRRTNHSE